MVLKHIDVRRKVPGINHKQILLGICVYDITSGTVLLSEPEKKNPRTPFQTVRSAFPDTLHVPKKLYRSCQLEY